MTEFLGTLAWAVVSVVAAVILSGCVSGILTLGWIELFARNSIQRRVVDAFRGGVSSSRIWEARGDIFDFVRRTPDPHRSPPYKEVLLACLDCQERVVALPTLAGMTPQGFYSLHHRQLCGILSTRLSQENMGAARMSVTPLTDFLYLLGRTGLHRGQRPVALHLLDYRRPYGLLHDGPPYPPLRSTPPTESLPSLEEQQAAASRALLDGASDTVDALQALMARQIVHRAFFFNFLFWVVVFLLVASSGVDTSGLWPAFKGSVRMLLVTAPLALATALAAAVVGTLVFNWLDRALATR